MKGLTLNKAFYFEVVKPLLESQFPHLKVPYYLKWVSKAFYQLPYLSNKIGSKIEACFMKENPLDTLPLLKEMINEIISFLTSLNIIDKMDNKHDYTIITNRLYRILPEQLKNIEILGAIDQWIKQDDVIVCSDQFCKFKDVLKQKGKKKRDDIGDLMI